MVKVSGVANQHIYIGATHYNIGDKVIVELPEDNVEIFSECVDNITILNSEIKEVEEKPIILKEKEEILEGENDGNILNTDKPIKQVGRKSTKKVEG